ncbi:dienelactone hydrolase [Pigmentiphaga litoralis]|uniref:dienelactone hydrolase family protein n=1 Tax=Pigmentiphaga litoralis TaxID=516702 RepID=UPI0016747A57|nr:dienelactone hydrolase family protein [Pigmentiphaga litoralis]GGX35461.1 dienelactone hydrolase [Pigmentiphaga litoralis]
MPAERIVVNAPDGACPAYVVSPAEGSAAAAPWPAVIFYGDAGGLRPAMVEMADTVAAAGYLVLVPDVYYRVGPYTPLVPKEVFAGDVGAVLGPLMSTTGNDKAAGDTEAFLAWLDAREDVRKGKVGAVGFCMCGGMALSAAAAWPDRFGAVASFHGGNLASDDPASPHLRVGAIQGDVYIASAERDEFYPPAMAARFEAALNEAGVTYTAEEYAGASHGWMVPDFPVYDANCAERGWTALIALFDRTLKPS